MSPARSRLLSAGFFALGMAGAAVTAVALVAARERWTAGDWPATTAEVVDAVAAGPSGGTAGYRLRVRFLPPGHAVVEAETVDEIGEHQLALLREVAPSPGGAAKNPTALVYYSPEQLDEVRLGPPGRGDRLAALGFALAGLAGLTASVAGFRRAADLVVSPAGSRPSGRTGRRNSSPR